MSGLNHGFVAAVKGDAVTKDTFERSRVQISVLTKNSAVGSQMTVFHLLPCRCLLLMCDKFKCVVPMLSHARNVHCYNNGKIPLGQKLKRHVCKFSH